MASGKGVLFESVWGCLELSPFSNSFKANLNGGVLGGANGPVAGNPISGEPDDFASAKYNGNGGSLSFWDFLIGENILNFSMPFHAERSDAVARLPNADFEG